jgi:hypothetical protein
MGDLYRGQVFASFINKTFSAADRIADVAGGHGEVLFFLHELGKHPTVIEPKPTGLPGWIHKVLRKRSKREGRLVQLDRPQRLQLSVEDADLTPFDLLVAMHPDEATEPALRRVVEFDLDFAIVPCCVFSMDGARRSRDEWSRYLASLAPGIQTAQLPMSGSNGVLWRKN